MKRVLLVNEASYNNTGFGKYGYNLLKELSKNPEIEVAEFAFNGLPLSARDRSEWIFYANSVIPGDPRHEKYSSDKDNRYGKWRFESVCLHFRPDYVLTLTDPWNCSFIFRSPLRRMFNLIYMPTVDSLPLLPQWVNKYVEADTVLTYSDWASDYIEKKYPNVNLGGVARFGVDNTFKPIRVKKEIDGRILGTVMRNQPRKSYPELMGMFKKLIDKGNDDLYLYCHCSVPDVIGWDFPQLLNHNGIQNRVLFTYKCTQCEEHYPSLFKGEKTYCKRCGAKKASIAYAKTCTDEQLNVVYNTFDYYIQYAAAEGAGIPPVEAAAACKTVFCTDATAMEDYKHTIGAYPLPPLKMKIPNMERQYRAVHNDDEAARIIHEVINQPADLLAKNNFEKWDVAKDMYNWEKVAGVWTAAIDDTPMKNKWNSREDYLVRIEDDELSNFDILDIYTKYIGITDDITALKILQEMNNQGQGDTVKQINTWIDHYNACEDIRLGIRELDNEKDYLEYAEIKAKIYGKARR